jgi:lysophospholipase L1-like esterase
MNIENRHISVWGDSILKGVVLDDATGEYRVHPANCVTRFANATKAIISNHASFGMTTGKAFERITRAIERNPPEKNDIVLVEFGGNDCDYCWREISEKPEDHHEPKTPICLFGDRLQAIIDTFKAHCLSPILMTLPPLEPNRYLDWISRGLDRSRILSWLGDVNKIYRWQEAYNEIIIQTAIENDIQLIDVRKRFLVSDRYTSLFCSDGIHPNENGHGIIYDSFISYVSGL